MWSIKELKENAKIAMKRFYWVAFAVCLIAGIITGEFSGSAGTASSVSNSLSTQQYSASPYDSYYDEYEMAEQLLEQQLLAFSDGEIAVIVFVLVGLALGIYLFCGVIGACYEVFLAAPVRVGQNRFFVMARGFDNITISTLFSTFRKGRYQNCFKVAWAKYWRICAWSLLFFIPGIIKSYQYMMVEYILAENPQIEPKRALELSKQMTDGEKWHIFCMQLSFIGWRLLGILFCCGLGLLFVAPYYHATFAELYTVLRSKAFVDGFTNAIELPGFDPTM